ncbi:kinesin, partial [Myxococcota bacterium]|nr:kinesin [Myxococcota bacterium]
APAAAAPAAAAPAAAAPAAAPSGGMAASLPMLLAGGGLAFAALSSAVTFIVGELAKLSGWELLAVFVALVLAYVLPVGFAAWLRLRRRDLGTVLEGAGWAVNTRLYLNGALARRFTTRPEAPNKRPRRSA